MFMKHKDGYIIPVLLYMASYQSTLVAVVQELKSNDDYIWFYSKSLQVCAATKDSLRMLGVRLFELCIEFARCALACDVPVALLLVMLSITVPHSDQRAAVG